MVDALATLAMLGLVGLVVSLGLTAMFGWGLMMVASDTPGEVYNAMLGWSVFGIVLGTVPTLMKRYRDDRRGGLSEAQRQERDRPQVLLHVLCAGVLFFMWGLFGQFGTGGLVVLALLVTAVFTYRDLRPERLPRLLFPSVPAPKP
jgi:cobalamin synthase